MEYSESDTCLGARGLRGSSLSNAMHACHAYLPFISTIHSCHASTMRMPASTRPCIYHAYTMRIPRSEVRISLMDAASAGRTDKRIEVGAPGYNEIWLTRAGQAVSSTIHACYMVSTRGLQPGHIPTSTATGLQCIELQRLGLQRLGLQSLGLHSCSNTIRRREAVGWGPLTSYAPAHILAHVLAYVLAYLLASYLPAYLQAYLQAY